MILDFCSSFPAFVSVALLTLANVVTSTGRFIHSVSCQMNTFCVVISSVEWSNRKEASGEAYQKTGIDDLVASSSFPATLSISGVKTSNKDTLTVQLLLSFKDTNSPADKEIWTQSSVKTRGRQIGDPEC
ncbi:hypothetical protein BLNAU_18535 [Blattamonas nauphoetae]|uniref:Secreted protein n=1 Tax=Blattamonas nauphoetae TaxID=2049346 RepID=A0ABQ9X467_9EUKA|nr:hypothetical protein BLNAU_18535 [Blattamonas nauphoetae]